MITLSGDFIQVLKITYFLLSPLRSPSRGSQLLQLLLKLYIIRGIGENKNKKKTMKYADGSKTITKQLCQHEPKWGGINSSGKTDGAKYLKLLRSKEPSGERNAMVFSPTFL